MDYISISPVNPTSVFSSKTLTLVFLWTRNQLSGTHVALIRRVRLTCVRAANGSEDFGTRHHYERDIPCVNTSDSPRLRDSRGWVVWGGLRSVGGEARFGG